MSWYLRLESWGVENDEGKDNRAWEGTASGIRRGAEWDAVIMQMLGKKQKGILKRRVHRERSQINLNRLRQTSAYNNSSSTSEATFFNSPRLSGGWKEQASRYLHAAVIKQCWSRTGTWICWLSVIWFHQQLVYKVSCRRSKYCSFVPLLHNVSLLQACGWRGFFFLFFFFNPGKNVSKLNLKIRWTLWCKELAFWCQQLSAQERLNHLMLFLLPLCLKICS